MVDIKVALRITDELKEGLNSGRLIRIGGVVRDAKTKRFVALLKEADLKQLDGGSYSKELPISIADISMISIQHQINALADKIEQVFRQLQKVEVVAKLINRKQDIDKFAQVEALVEKAVIASRANDLQEIKRIRLEAITLHKYFSKLFASFNDNEMREILKIMPEMLSDHNRYLIAVTKFRIALETMIGDSDDALKTIQHLEEDVANLDRNLKRVMNQPQTLFFIKDEHRAIVKKVHGDLKNVCELRPQYIVLQEEGCLQLIENINEDVVDEQ